jgi:hypothetical protein
MRWAICGDSRCKHCIVAHRGGKYTHDRYSQPCAAYNQTNTALATGAITHPGVNGHYSLRSKQVCTLCAAASLLMSTLQASPSLRSASRAPSLAS